MELKKCFSSIGRAGSCGIEYKRIAQGELDFSFYRSLKPWDHAAGDLIIREAGGKVAYLNNTLYLFKRSGFSGLLCAPSENCWQQVAKIISKIFQLKFLKILNLICTYKCGENSTFLEVH